MDENNLQEKRSPDGEENGRPGFSVLREGRKLQDMTMEQLRDRFEMLFGEAPAQHLTALHLTKRIPSATRASWQASCAPPGR